MSVDHSTTSARPAPRGADIVERMRVVILAGVPVGVLIGGVGSRLAMFVLRLTSPDYVVGVTSDDGFTIGRTTVGGTYNLLNLGASVGILGAALYFVVAPLLIGPTWFRRLTVALASGAVIGSLLVHADGVDFNLLQPTWLAVGLFIALPAAFGAAIGPMTDRVATSQGRWSRGRWRVAAPIVLVLAFPLSLFAVAVVTVGVAVAFVARSALPATPSPTARLLLRAAWLSIAVLGLVALIGDIGDLSRG